MNPASFIQAPLGVVPIGEIPTETPLVSLLPYGESLTQNRSQQALPGLTVPAFNLMAATNKEKVLTANYQPEPVVATDLRQSTVKLAEISKNGSNIWKVLGQPE